MTGLENLLQPVVETVETILDTIQAIKDLPDVALEGGDTAPIVGALEKRDSLRIFRAGRNVISIILFRHDLMPPFFNIWNHRYKSRIIY